MNIRRYETWLFDCDGVVLDSNALKSRTFHRLVSQFGDEVADAFVAYHVANGGISRFIKLHYLFEHLLHRAPEVGQIEALARDYGALLRDQLLACPETPGLRDFLQRRPAGSKSFVVSGADEIELREVLALRGLATMFDGIYGSPRTKLQILTALEPVADTAVFLGDSRYDHQAAASFGIDFIFVSGCSELEDWQRYVAEHGIPHVSDLGELHPR